MKAGAPNYTSSHYIFTTMHVQSKGEKKQLSLKNVLKEAVKTFNFINP